MQNHGLLVGREGHDLLDAVCVALRHVAPPVRVVKVHLARVAVLHRLNTAVVPTEKERFILPCIYFGILMVCVTRALYSAGGGKLHSALE